MDFDHSDHVVDLSQHPWLLIIVLHQLGAKPQPCKRGSKIMGHSCYHAGAIFIEATESVPACG